MAKQTSKQARFPTMKLPKPIIAIQNKVDAIEEAKKTRAKCADEIKDLKFALGKLLKKHKTKLAHDRNGTITYRMCGYVVVLHSDEKIDAKVEKES